MSRAFTPNRFIGQRSERRPGAIYHEINDAWMQLADLYEELGRSISEVRRTNLITQAALADALGLSRNQVALYERGARWKQDRPAIERIVKYLEGLEK